jgi:hypothetical protein
MREVKKEEGMKAGKSGFTTEAQRHREEKFRQSLPNPNHNPRWDSGEYD